MSKAPTNDYIVCIVCPNGCRLRVSSGEQMEVTGNKCNRGVAFALQEVTAPKRNLTTTLPTDFANVSMLPVRLSTQVDREKLFDIMAVCRNTKITSIVKTGDVIVKNIANSGADLIASSNILHWLYGAKK